MTRKYVCGYAGCHDLVDRPGLCPKHLAVIREKRSNADRAMDRNRDSASERGYGIEWRKFRARYLAAHPACSRCKSAATDVHHIVPLSDGGQLLDESNVEALCHTCHSRETCGESRSWRIRATPRIHVTLVCGPPGAGKSSYVRQRAMVGDVIIDLDDIIQAITILPRYERCAGVVPFAFAVRDAIIEQACKSDEVRMLWVIACLPNKDERERIASRLSADVVMMDVDESECLRRVGNDPARATVRLLSERLIREWWEEYRSNA